MDSTQTEVILRRFETPDDVREMVKGRFEIVRLGGLTIGRGNLPAGVEVVRTPEEEDQ
jgi:hypothetical protein